MIRLRCGTVHVSLGIFEAENKLDILVIYQRLELPGDVFCAGLMLAMDKGEFSPRLRFGGVKNSLGVGLKRPVLFLLESSFRHILARRQADPRQIRIREEHLFNTLSEVVNRSGVIDIVGDSILAVGPIVENVPGNKVEFDITALGITHHLPPECDLLVNGYLLQGLKIVQYLGVVKADSITRIVLLPLNG